MADFASIRFQPQRPLLRELSADRLNSILAEIKRNTPKGERGITVRQDGNQTWIGLAASLPRATSTPTTPQPWDLIARQDPDNENQYLVTVRPGTLNGFLPSNWNTEGANGGKDVPCADTGLYYAKAVIATDGQNITGVTIAINTTAPTEQEPVEFGIESEVQYLFGLFSEGQVYRVIGSGNITLQPKTWLVVSADPAASPGESPYDIYYRLQ